MGNVDAQTLDSIEVLRAAQARLAADQAKQAELASQADGLDPKAVATVRAMLDRRIEQARAGVAQATSTVRSERRQLLAERDKLQALIEAERAEVDTLQLLRRIGDIDMQQFNQRIEPIRAAVRKARDDVTRIGARILNMNAELGDESATPRKARAAS